VRINEQIRAKEVRLISDDGRQLGVFTLPKALEKAQMGSLDLVEISPKAEPPVCRIMDYGKYIYQQHKKASEAKKKQKRVQTKEMRFSISIAEGDYQVKLRSLLSFLSHGDKVEVKLRFRGREVQHKELGLQLLQRLKQDIQETATVEREATLEGKQMIMVLMPKK
jgi:translation initiation factor IF-3